MAVNRVQTRRTEAPCFPAGRMRLGPLVDTRRVTVTETMSATPRTPTVSSPLRELVGFIRWFITGRRA